MIVQGKTTFTNFSSNSGNDLNASTFYLNANNDSSNSNANIGSVSLSKNHGRFILSRMEKYIHPIRVGRETEDSGGTRL